MKKYAVLLFLLSFPLFLFSQKKASKITVDAVLKGKVKNDSLQVFTWVDELCEYKSVYNSKKYTEEELKNTLFLINSSHRMLLYTSPTSFQDKDFEPNRNMKLLEEEYKKVRNEYSGMKIVNQPSWNSLRDSVIRQIDEHYALIKTTLSAQLNHELFLKNIYASGCMKYAHALASNNSDELMQVWKEQEEELKEKNCCPEEFMKHFYEKYNSEKRLEYAWSDVLNFGWWNCANSQVYDVSNSVNLEDKYKSLFIDTKTMDCDEP